MEPQADGRPSSALPGFVQIGDAEIVAAYREILELDRPMLMREAEQLQIAPAAAVGGLLDLALAIGVAALLGFGVVSLIGGIVFLGGFTLLSALEHRARIARGEASPFSTLVAIGPLSRFAIARGFEDWQKRSRRPDLVVDVGSLEVLEPVARYLATPILEQARILAAASPSDIDRNLAERAEARRDELLAQAARETDDTWRHAATDQAAHYAERARVLRLRYEEGLRARDRILAEADALRADLDRLTERRRLLREMGTSRVPVPRAEAQDEGHEVRLRIAALTASLRSQEGDVRAHVAAELEMNALERSVAEGR